jgi:hypothetical protein
MKIIILADQKKLSRNFHDFFPFYRWDKFFRKDGINIKIIQDHTYFEKYDYDCAIISTRTFFKNREDFKGFLISLNQKIPKVFLFDAADTSGIVDFDLIQFVDGIIKKQVLKDLDFYLSNDYDISVRPWLNNIPQIPSYLNYVPARTEDLNKIVVGWNIGMSDYRNFYGYWGFLRNYGTYPLLKDNFTNLIRNKKNLTSFRGEISYGNPEISFQRNEMLNYLKLSELDGIITGGKVSRNAYLKELKQAKITLSPYGWGEICYRDFEAMMSGSLLLKPSMNHVNTFPDFYTENETYVSLNWDLSDLNNKISDINLNYNDYIKISRNAFEKFYYFQNSYTEFKLNFLKCIGKV